MESDKERLLRRLLSQAGEIAIAVSGGVDSMTLAAVASSEAGCRATLFHAVSPAVPAEATDRVVTTSHQRGWDLRLVDAAELAHAKYVQNPMNRCFYCKTRLYETIRNVYTGPILSGTNIDDLGDFRPGLDAAKAARVRHPYVEAQIDKSEIRRIAATLGLSEIAQLPASPCLSSRIETGISISVERLAVVEEVEAHVAQTMGDEIVRCRIRATGIEIQLGEPGMLKLTEDMRASLTHDVRKITAKHGVGVHHVAYGPYRMGSAFLKSDVPVV